MIDIFNLKKHGIFMSFIGKSKLLFNYITSACVQKLTNLTKK